MALISVGLTNQPNIPVKPLSNELEPEVDTALPAPEITRALHEALANGRITPFEEPDWARRLQNDFAGASAALASLGRTMNTTSVTGRLGLRRDERLALRNRRDRIQEAIHAKMALGFNYDAAWNHVKREHARWFETMD